MKFIKDAEYNYENSKINEENGYVKWFDLKKDGKKARLFEIYANIFFWILFHFLIKRNEEVLKELTAIEFILFVALTVVVLLFIGYCLKGFISLIILSKGRLSEHCFISLKNTTAIYNAETSRSRVLASYAVPLILFVSVFSFICLFTNGLIKAFFAFQILSVFFISVYDIYMFILCLRKTQKSDVIFGEFKKKV